MPKNDILIKTNGLSSKINQSASVTNDISAIANGLLSKTNQSASATNDISTATNGLSILMNDLYCMIFNK